MSGPACVDGDKPGHTGLAVRILPGGGDQPGGEKGHTVSGVIGGADVQHHGPVGGQGAPTLILAGNRLDAVKLPCQVLKRLQRRFYRAGIRRGTHLARGIGQGEITHLAAIAHIEVGHAAVANPSAPVQVQGDTGKPRKEKASCTQV